MAAQKGSTGTSRGGSGKSNTKKSTAARKTSGSTGRKTQARSTKRGNSGARGKNAAKNTSGSAVRSEIGILVALALTLFGTLSVFGLCGSVGEAVRNILLGVFGIFAYVAPLLLFLAVMFFASNLGNGKAMGKLVAALLIVPDLCGLIQLVVSPYVQGEALKDIYAARTGGGWLGGAVKQGLCAVFDVVGAYLVLVLILLICLVVITERSITRWLRTGGERILGRAREDYDYRVEQNEENRARNEEKRNEQRIRKEERRRQEEERREERRRQAEEREEKLEKELKEERARRTDHKTRGVEISENTVIGDAGEEPTIPGDTDSEKVRLSDDGTRNVKDDPADVRTGNETDRPADGRTGSRYSRPSDHLDEYEEELLELPEDEEQQRTADPEKPDTDRYSSQDTEEADDPFRLPEDEPEDATVEWWNPHETSDPLSGDVIDRLERELKHADKRGPAAEEPGETEREASAGDASEGDFEAVFGVSEDDPFRLPEDPEDEPDVLAEGVRRLDFMQDRVDQRMEEFETVKPSGRRVPAGVTPEEGSDGENTISESEEDTEEFAPENGAEYKTNRSKGTAPGAENRIAQRPDPGANEVPGQKTGAGMSGGAGQKPGAGMNISSGQKPAPPVRRYVKPPTSLLNSGGHTERDPQAELDRVAAKLQDTLKRFGVNVTITDVSRGPSVTRYELLPEAGTRVNRITSLSDDIKLALAATDIRIEAPIPGKSAIGIEVPNKRRETVYLKDLVESAELKGHASKIAFAAGKDIAGKVVVADIAKMPHMLIAGTTGSGKSVFTNSIIMTILFRATPDEVKLIIVDPKVVEFGIYNGIPHLMTPVVTDPRKAAEALRWATAEMSRRYQTFANENVRDLKGYNKKIEREHLTDKNGEPLKKLPQIVIIIDELADLMMVAAKEVEETICRLAQLARAAGIHLIIATQRPSVDVVTGLIKANIPSRVALLVSSGVDSRTIIDMNGAEKLLGNGDMLFAPSGYAKPVRLQGAFVSDEEVRSVVDFLKKQTPEGGAYDESMFEEVEAAESEAGGENRNERDELFADAGRFLIEKKRASVSLLQRKFRVGFNRAARIIDQLEEAGVVGEELGTKPRNVLMTPEEFEEFLKSKE